MSYLALKKELIYWAGLLSKKGFVCGSSGNISYKINKDKILITTHNCYLGKLSPNEILLIDRKGKILRGEGKITSEKKLHLDIHNKFKEINVILHAHPPYTLAFFCYFKRLEILSFEAKFYLSSLKIIPQKTPLVLETKPVLSALENSPIVVLKNHGVVAIGNDFKSTFGLIELLEEQSKINLLLKSIKK